MAFPIHEMAALGTAACWATTGLIAADAVRALGPFHFNLWRQGFVTLILVCLVGGFGLWQGLDPAAMGVLAASGVVGNLLGDTFNFAAVGRLGPRRAGAIFALNAPTAVLGWALLGETLAVRAGSGIGLTAAGVAVAILGRPRVNAHRLESLRGTLLPGLAFGLLPALGQAAGSLIERTLMHGGLDLWLASLVRVGASGLATGMVAATPWAPPRPRAVSRAVVGLTALTAVVGLLIGMTLFLFALQGCRPGSSPRCRRPRR